MVIVIVAHRANQRRLVHPLGRQREQFAESHSRQGGLNRLEFPAYILRRVRLGIERVKLGRAAGQIQDDALLRLAEAFALDRARRRTGGQQVREIQARDAQAADAEQFPAVDEAGRDAGVPQVQHERTRERFGA